MQGKTQEALPHLQAGLGPDISVPGRTRLVLALMEAGRLSDADAKLEPLIRAEPGYATSWLIGAALRNEQGRTTEARQLFGNLLARNPQFIVDTPYLNFELAELYSLLGSNRQAVVHYEKALEVSPDMTNALNNCAWVMATDADDKLRDGRRAVELAQRGCELTGWQQPVFIGTLAAAYAEAGRFDDAVKMAERARDLAQRQGNEAVAKRNSELLEIYRQGKAYREKAA
jgi:tetratricopeptide (TPR) repeat protein